MLKISCFLALVDLHEQARIYEVIELHADFMKNAFDMPAVDDFTHDLHGLLELHTKP